MKKTKPAKLRIAELRVKHDRMTQAELAQQAGLSKTTISNLESGDLKRIELGTVAKLCQTLQCTPNDLFQLPVTFNRPINADRVDENIVLLSKQEYDWMLSEKKNRPKNKTSLRGSIVLLGDLEEGSREIAKMFKKSLEKTAREL